MLPNQSQLKKPSSHPRAELREPSTPKREEAKLSQSTFTKSSSRSTLTSELARRPWTSWTLSSMTPSTELRWKPPSSSDLIREEPSLPEKYKLQSSYYFLENSPDTPSAKAPRPSLNSHLADRHQSLEYKFLIN